MRLGKGKKIQVSLQFLKNQDQISEHQSELSVCDSPYNHAKPGKGTLPLADSTSAQSGHTELLSAETVYRLGDCESQQKLAIREPLEFWCQFNLELLVFYSRSLDKESHPCGFATRCACSHALMRTHKHTTHSRPLNKWRTDKFSWLSLSKYFPESVPQSKLINSSYKLPVLPQYLHNSALVDWVQ